MVKTKKKIIVHSTISIHSQKFDSACTCRTRINDLFAMCPKKFEKNQAATTINLKTEISFDSISLLRWFIYHQWFEFLQWLLTKTDLYSLFRHFQIRRTHSEISTFRELVGYKLPSSRTELFQDLIREYIGRSSSEWLRIRAQMTCQKSEGSGKFYRRLLSS